MKIELLYTDDCPNWKDVSEEIKAVTSEFNLHEAVELIRVSDIDEAKRLSFLGSPTVRVNGKDIDTNLLRGEFGISCRLYWINGSPVGKPPREWLINALSLNKRL